MTGPTDPDDTLEHEYLDKAKWQTVHNCAHSAARCTDEDHRQCPYCHRTYCAFDNGHRCEPLKKKNEQLLRKGEHERELLAQPIHSAHTELNVGSFVLGFAGVLVAIGAFDSPGPRIFAVLVALALTFMWRELRRGKIGSMDDLPSAQDLAPHYPITVQTGKFDYERWKTERKDARANHGTALSRSCPRCDARPQTVCTNPATGTKRPVPHDAR